MVDHVGLGVHPPCCIPIEYEDLIAVTITKQNITKEQSQPNLLKMHLMQQTTIAPNQRGIRNISIIINHVNYEL